MSADSTSQTPSETLHLFIAAINAHDADALVEMMAMEHVFVDSLGNRVKGAASMKAGWLGYLEMCPDYWLRVDQSVANDDTILAAGEAGGTIDGIPWQTPAAWMAIVRNGLVVEWRVFADNKPVYEILARRKSRGLFTVIYDSSKLRDVGLEKCEGALVREFCRVWHV